ncbi:MAG: hypothetical protein RL354_742 [Planctomycetota bacterium]
MFPRMRGRIFQRLPVLGALAAATSWFADGTGTATSPARVEFTHLGTGEYAQLASALQDSPPRDGTGTAGSPTDARLSSFASEAPSTTADKPPETTLERAERSRQAAEEALRKSVLPQPMGRERFSALLNAIHPALASDAALLDAHASYLGVVEQQRETTSRQILRLLPAAYRFDAARQAFTPRATPELVALLSLREKSQRAIAAAERALLDGTSSATPPDRRAQFANAILAWRLEQLPAEQLLASTRLTLLEILQQLRLTAETRESLAATLTDYATALARAVDTRSTLLPELERQRALIETTAGALWLYAPDETSGPTDAQLAALDDQAFATELAIRDIHFDALVRLRARLQPRDGRRLVELWQRAVHPELFEDERMLARMVEDTLAHPSFTADQDAALLDALETSYQRLEPLSRAACEAADLVLPRLAGGGMSAMAAEIDARIAVADAQTRRRAFVKEAMQRVRGMLGDADPAMTARIDDAIYTIDSLGRADQFEARTLAVRRDALADEPAARPAGKTAPGNAATGTPGPAPNGADAPTPDRPNAADDASASPREPQADTPPRSGRGSRGGRRTSDR